MAISYRTRDQKIARTGERVIDVFTLRSGTIGKDLGDGWFIVETADGDTFETHADNVCSILYGRVRYPQYV